MWHVPIIGKRIIDETGKYLGSGAVDETAWYNNISDPAAAL
jgi:hypothetical protein